MLILLAGNKIKEKSQKLHNILTDLRKKRPNANFSNLDKIDLEKQKLEELINTQGSLFDEKNIYLLTNTLQDLDFKKEFLKKIKDIQKSENAFIINEDIYDKILIGKLEKFSFKTLIFYQPELKENIFIMSDHLLNKNKKML